MRFHWIAPLVLACAFVSTADARTVSEVQAPGPDGPLAGTMIDAGPGKPVALIIPGSGPTDRDGNSPAGVSAAPYRLLAEALAERGISTVRVDKRGMFGSKAAGNPNAVTVASYAADIRSWTGTIRRKTGADCVWVIGHSEGVLMALAAAAENEQGICGLVLASGAGRRLSDVLRDQLRSAPAFAPHLDTALAAIAKLEGGQKVDTNGMDKLLLSLFAPVVQDYLLDIFSYDPAVLAARVDVPMLVLQGQADLQTGEADARRIAGANPRAKLVLLPAVNHVLKAVPADDRAANVAAYSDSTRPLAPGVADAVAEFIGR